MVAVMKALHIERPVLVGHSMAGEELSSVGSRFPEKVAGLVYLDAATDFALYDPGHPLLEVEMNDIRRRIDEIEAGGVDERKKLLELESAAVRFESALHESNAGIGHMPPLPPRSPIAAALNFGMQKYARIPVPAMAIYACPHNWDRLPDGAGNVATGWLRKGRSVSAGRKTGLKRAKQTQSNPHPRRTLLQNASNQLQSLRRPEIRNLRRGSLVVFNLRIIWRDVTAVCAQESAGGM